MFFLRSSVIVMAAAARSHLPVLRSCAGLDALERRVDDRLLDPEVLGDQVDQVDVEADRSCLVSFELERRVRQVGAGRELARGGISVTPAAAAPPLVAPEPPPAPPEPPEEPELQAARPKAAAAATTTTRERVVMREVTGGLSWFGRRTDPDAQSGIMARVAFRSGICPVTTAYHRGVVTGDDTRYDDLRTWSVDRLRSEQTARLRETVQAAYASVPHYRAAFDAMGLHPHDLRSLDDLARFPFTTKAELRESIPSACSPCPGSRWPASTPRRAPPARRRSSATPGPTSTCGPSLHRARSAPPVCGPATSSTSPSATGCSPAASAAITGPSAWAARWCRRPPGRPPARCSYGRLRRRRVCCARRPMRWILDESAARGSTRPRPRCGSACSGPSPGRRPCGPRSSRPSPSTPSTSTACPR